MMLRDACHYLKKRLFRQPHRRTASGIILPNGSDGLLLNGFRYQVDFLDRESGEVMKTDWVTNMIPNAALNDVISVYLAAATQKTTWYVGLADNAGFTAFAAGDTAASHTGWTEWTSYSESVRQTWSAGTVAAGQVTNSSTITFTINATGTLKGCFLISNSTKAGVTGLIYSQGPFDAGNQSVVNGTPLRVNATFSATSAS